MRTVMVMKHEMFTENNSTKIMKVDVGVAMFHSFGLDYEELNNGVGTFSTAIVEFKDGTIRNIPVELIKFLIPTQI